MNVHTNTNYALQTYKQSKASSSHAKCCLPTLRCLCITQTLEFHAGKSFWLARYHKERVWNPKSYNDPILLQRQGQWAFDTPVNIDVTAEWATISVDTSPFKQLGRLEQGNNNNNLASDLKPFIIRSML